MFFLLFSHPFGVLPFILVFHRICRVNQCEEYLFLIAEKSFKFGNRKRHPIPQSTDLIGHEL